MAAKFDPKAKAKRQKIVLAVLGVVLIGVLAWQVPSVLKIMNKKPPPAATAPPPAAVAVPAAGTPVAATGTAGAAAPAGTLIDSDPMAQAAGGQLVSFDRFSSKDPFRQQLGEGASAPAAPAKDSTPPAPSGGQRQQPPPPPPPPPPAPVGTTSARISVNGVAEKVAVGGTFPAEDPVFVLVSLTKTTAKIGISGGSLDTGSATITLKKGKKLTLQNTADGAQYELVLVSTS
jgi:hypothetical protein